jgi:hypothetical protein
LQRAIPNALPVVSARTAASVVRLHGFIEKIEDKHLPLHFCQQDEAKLQAYKAGKVLGSILRGRVCAEE